VLLENLHNLLYQLEEYAMNQRTVRLTEQQVNEIPAVIYTVGMSEVEEPTCSICLADYEPNERLRVLPCRHCFHQECLDPWLARNANCPNCRTSLVPGDDSDNTNDLEAGGRAGDTVRDGGIARDGSAGSGSEEDMIRQHLAQQGGSEVMQQTQAAEI
jgi:E3 ubiquitin-protein ligase RNF38/44